MNAARDIAPSAEPSAAARCPTPPELAAAMVHEISQPLTALLINAEAGLQWLQCLSPDLQEVRQSVEAIRAEGRRACDLIRGFRQVLDNDVLIQEDLGVTDLVEDSVQLVLQDIDREQVDLSLQVESRIPCVVGNRAQLQQVLVNLLLNAIQAMSGQQVQRRLVVTAHQDSPASVAISILDTGPGISKDDLGRLFEPFFTTKGEGRGMGLAICRTVAAAHGGWINVDGAAGAGATFRLVLPARS